MVGWSEISVRRLFAPVQIGRVVWFLVRSSMLGNVSLANFVRSEQSGRGTFFILSIKILMKICIFVLLFHVLAISATKNMSIKELKLRIQFCQFQTCLKCAKMLKYHRNSKIGTVSVLQNNPGTTKITYIIFSFVKCYTSCPNAVKTNYLHNCLSKFSTNKFLYLPKIIFSDKNRYFKLRGLICVYHHLWNQPMNPNVAWISHGPS